VLSLATECEKEYWREIVCGKELKTVYEMELKKELS
jgi:hypothetical protein